MKRVVLFVILGAAVMAPPLLESCGPFLRSALFYLKRAASTDSASYARGRLGVVAPSFDRKNLVVAYRYYSGIPLTTGEASAFYPVAAAAPPAKSAIDEWSEARAAAGGSNQPAIEPYKKLQKEGAFDNYLNCLDDAFRTATATLAKRSATWGAKSDNLREWLEGQDQVFSNCSGPRNIPGPANGKDPLLVADRQYQIAAAAFYAEDWALARRAFDEVAANPASPWRSRVPYLKARVSIREATLGGNQEAFARAEKELAAAGDQSLAGYVAAQSRPIERLRELGDALLKPQPQKQAAQTITDFVLLYDKLRDGQIGKAEELTSKSDLADWIESFQLRSHAHALEQWRATKRLPWLVAAISTAKVSDSDAPELIAGANGLATDSPAYVAVAYEAARLQIDKGEEESARQRIETALKQPMPVSAKNLLLEERMKVARDWADFLKFAPRVPVGQSFFEGEEETDWKGGALLDDDAVAVFNHVLPLRMWLDAAKSTALPAMVRADLAAAGWTRAILLRKNAEAKAFATLLGTTHPELSAAMKNYSAAESNLAQFAAVYTMLKTPGFSPWLRSGFGRDLKIGELSEYRDNWWSKQEPAEKTGAKFLPDADREEGEAEWKALITSAGNGASYLAAETVGYTTQHPADPRAPEALALAVRATHFSITDDRTGTYSKQAFDLLHAKYPNSSFAKNTKYWYK